MKVTIVGLTFQNVKCAFFLAIGLVYLVTDAPRLDNVTQLKFYSGLLMFSSNFCQSYHLCWCFSINFKEAKCIILENCTH